MKRILLFIMGLTITFVLSAQSDSLKAAYKQVCTTLKEYEFLSEDAHDDHGKTTSITLKVQQGIFVFTFVDNFGSFNDPVFGFRHGAKTVKVPVSEAYFSADSYYHTNDIKIGGKNGIEMTYKGKKILLRKFEINGEDLSLRKLHKELIRLQEIMLSEKYTGSLGIEETSNKKSTSKAAHKQKKKNVTPVQPRQRKHVPAGN